jgi:DNA invertase Pin-like site-specific DNA recombinase
MLPGERGDGKIQGWHRDRLAVIYVRQSSRQQVVDHGESTRLQYGLTERAAGLGWPASRVMVIDEDLGRSAANAAERPGFARLVAEITMGHVGLVLGLEMSRLARAGRDWHQLIELCSLAGALLADADGVYDPNWYNDRLLLGLKGTMSEGRAASDQAADGFGAAGQGRPRGAGGSAAGRVCAPAVGGGCAGPR